MHRMVRFAEQPRIAVSAAVLAFLLGLVHSTSMAASGSVVSPTTQPREVSGIDVAAIERIESAIPHKAIVAPLRPRRLLIFDLNVNYGGHPSAAHASYAFKLTGERTGAFQTVVSRDPTVFEPGTLGQFDAVFFNNTVGNLFTNAALRESLVRFVYRGGGLLGVHGTSVAFTQWPGAVEDWAEFGLMIGARGANHRQSTERVFIKLDEPEHPLNRVFGRRGFEYRDEFFRVHDPYSRRRVRVLLSIDTERTDLSQGAGYGKVERADNDYALAWVRNYGRGRTFYCTIAHNPYVFWDPVMLEFYLRAIQFALGDLAAPTIPSSLATPAVRAQEKLGWRVAGAGRAETFLDKAIDQAAELGLAYLAVSSKQRLSADTPKSLDDGLTDADVRALRLKLDGAAVRVLIYEIENVPKTLSEWKRAFAFARDLGAEVVIVSQPPELLEPLTQLCGAFDIRLAIRASNGAEPRDYSNLGKKLDASPLTARWIGVAASPVSWQQGGVDAIAAAKELGGRVLLVELGSPAADGMTSSVGGAHDSLAVAEKFIEELHHSEVEPALFVVPFGQARADEAKRCVDAMGRTSLRLAAGIPAAMDARQP